MGVFLALCGVCACALMQVLLLPIGRGFTGQCLDIGTWDLASAIGGRVPEAVVTFEPREEALGAWQEVKGEAMSVNEALYAGAMGLNICLLKSNKNTSSYSREGFKQPLPRVTLGMELSKTHLELL